jgi:hypothetical protein
MAGFVSVEMSGFAVNVDAGAGFLFEKCREVVVESLTVQANPSNTVPVVRIVAADAATIAGCTIVTKVPGLAVVFEDAQAITRFTDNDIRGVVSFYGGPPVLGTKPDLPKLAASLKRTTVKLNTAPGSLFMSRNTLEIVTIGRAKFTELTEFTATQRDTLEGLFQTAAITDNAMSASPLFESAALTLVALTLPLVPIGDPLGVFVADTATVTGTVSGRSDFKLAVLTKPNQCSDAANIPSILKTV